MEIWAVGTLNQLFMRGPHTEIKLSTKKKTFSGKTLFFVIGPFSSPHSISLNVRF